MAGLLKSAAKASDEIIGASDNVAREGLSVGAKAARQALEESASAEAVAAARRATPPTGPIETASQIDNIGKTVKEEPAKLAEEADQARKVGEGMQNNTPPTQQQVASDGAPAGEDVPPTPNGDKSQFQDPATVQGRVDYIVKKTGWTPSKVLLCFGGISLTAFAIHIGALVNENDGASFKIKSIKVEKSTTNANDRKVTLTFDRSDVKYRGPPNNPERKVSPEYVRVRKNDIITSFSGSKFPSALTNGIQIQNVVGDAAVFTIPSSAKQTFFARLITQPNSSVSPRDYDDTRFSQSGYVYERDFSADNERFVLSTCFYNMLGEGLSDMFTFTANLLDDLLNKLAIPVVTAVGAGAGKVASAGFCAAVPIFCDSTIWLVVLIGVVAMIIMMAIS